MVSRAPSRPKLERRIDSVRDDSDLLYGIENGYFKRAQKTGESGDLFTACLCGMPQNERKQSDHGEVEMATRQSSPRQHSPAQCRPEIPPEGLVVGTSPSGI